MAFNMDPTLRQRMGVAYLAGIRFLGTMTALYTAATATASFGMQLGAAGALVFLDAMSLFLWSWPQRTRRDGSPTREERVSQYRHEDAFLLLDLRVCFIGVNVNTALDPLGWYCRVADRGLTLALIAMKALWSTSCGSSCSPDDVDRRAA